MLQFVAYFMIVIYCLSYVYVSLYHSFIVLAIVITIVHYDHKTFIEQVLHSRVGSWPCRQTLG
jgi:hypothetical protein